MQAIAGAISQLVARVAGILSTLFVGILAGGSVLALGTKAVVLVPMLACALAMLWIPYSPLIAIVSTVAVNVEIAGPLTISRLAIVFGFFVAYLQGIKGQTARLHIPGLAGALGLCFFAWVFFVGLALPGGGGLLSRVGPYIIFAAIFFMVLMYADTLQRLRLVLITLIVSGAVQGALVMAEALFGFAPFGGWHAELAADRGDTEVRVVGTSAHPIILAGYFQVVMVACGVMLLTTKDNRMRLILLGLLGLFVASWWLAYARSSWIGMGALLFVAMVSTTRPTRILAITGGTLGFILLWIYDFSPTALINAIESLATVQKSSTRAGVAAGSESFGWRTENWVAAIKMWAGSPIFGVGLEQSKQNMLANLPWGSLGHQFISHEVPHNMFLILLAEAGLPAFTIFVIFWIMAVQGIQRAWRIPELYPYAVAILTMLSAQFVTFFFNPLPREVFLTLAMALALGRIAQTYERPTGGKPRLRQAQGLSQA